MRTLIHTFSLFLFVLLSTQIHAQDLKISSGLEGEIYHQFAIDITNNTDVDLQIASSQGSLENFNNLNTNNFQLGFVQYDVLLYNELENPKIKEYLKVFFPLYQEEIHLITRKNSEIKKLEDLKDKKVGIGSTSSGTQITAKFIQYNTSIPWKSVNIDFSKSLNYLINDSIDAFFYVGAAPSNYLKSLSPDLKKLIRLIPIKHKNLKDFYKNSIIKKEFYPWLDSDIKTLAVKSLMIINTKNIDAKSEEKIELLYNDLKDNLKGIQKNKLSHSKWKDVDFSDMDGVDWPVYKEKYISLDFFSLLLAYLAAILSFIQIYFIINKLWKRKHEKVVAESISISAMFISLIINGSFAFKNLHDGGIPQFAANILWIIASIISTIIGIGFFVAAKKDQNIWTLLKQALNLERKEAGDLAKIFFQPSGAENIIEILGRMAMVDEDLDPREKDFIQGFADHWHIELDWDSIKKYLNEEGDRYEKIKAAMRKYLETSPQKEQVQQLRDVFNLLVNIDEVVTEEEQMIMDELEGLIAQYIDQDIELESYRVAVVPQSQEQDDAVSKLLKDLQREKVAGGYAYLSEPYYSERYAEIISGQYRAIHVFSVVIKPKHLQDSEYLDKLLNKESQKS